LRIIPPDQSDPHLPEKPWQLNSKKPVDKSHTRSSLDQRYQSISIRIHCKHGKLTH
jgi:hypothetical protein